MPRHFSKLPHVGTTIFTVISQRAAELNAINLAQGFPDYDPPERLKQLVAEHVACGQNQHAPMAGVVKLKEQIARKFARAHGLEPDPITEITVTLGATEGLFSALLALVHPGDEVIVFDPTYDSYAPAVILARGAYGTHSADAACLRDRLGSRPCCGDRPDTSHHPEQSA